MPRRPTHIVFGGLAGVIAASAVGPNEASPFSLIEAAAGLVGGCIGGAAPDLIEPATTPLHRGVFHSAALGGGALAAAAKYGKELEHDLRRGLAALHAEAQAETDPTRRALKWLLVILAHAATGFAVGIGAGYLSHLALDAVASPSSLPVVCKGL